MSIFRAPLLRLLPAVACAMLVTSSCGDDSSVSNMGTARLSVNVRIDNAFTYPDGTVAVTPSFILPDAASVGLSMRSLANDYSHVWTSFDDFPQDDTYFAGTYYMQAFCGYEQEGFGKPYYKAEQEIDLMPGAVMEAEMVLHPVSTANTVSFTPELLDYFTSVRAYLHAEGGGYFDCLLSETDILYILPGTTALYLDLTLPDGRVASYRAAEVNGAQSGVFYEYVVSLDFKDSVPVVTTAVGSVVASQVLDEAFLSAVPPTIVTSGWVSDVTMVLPEGEQPDRPVTATVSSSSPLSHLNLTVNSAYMNSLGVPAQCDLLTLSDGDAALLSSLGLKFNVSSTGADVNFTEFLGNLVFLNEAQAVTSIALFAEDSRGCTTSPVMMTVRSTPMEITVKSVPDIMVGVREAEIDVATEANDFASHVDMELLDSSGKWRSTEILSAAEISDGLYRIRFAIPEGTADINARILYCKEVRAEVLINRFMPSFNLEVDAFATYCCVRVIAADPELQAMIVRGLFPYLNGKQASVLARFPESGVIVVTNLKPSTTYRLTSTMMRQPDSADFTPESKFTTESSPSLPNAEFEERKDGVIYQDLPCGGRYSQTNVAIFNWQNKRSFAQQVPKEWANTNAKTFSRKSGNYNTWYMQPSVFTVLADTEDTSFAVCLRSVAFDINGQIIPDYTQTGTPYLKYSPIIPQIASRAAGKLFLGSYSFDPATMEETYNDVVDWHSRPMALNGYYKYNPSSTDPSDTGLAIIEVHGEVDGKDVVIGSATAYLPVANSYTAFQASLSYDYFGVKATGLKVMFASSANIGTIEEESASVITTPDAVEGASVGSTLWLDHVNLSY